MNDQVALWEANQVFIRTDYIELLQLILLSSVLESAVTFRKATRIPIKMNSFEEYKMELRRSLLPIATLVLFWLATSCNSPTQDNDSGTDGDADGDGDGDADGDGDGDVDGDVDGDSDGDVDGDSDGDVDSDGDADGDADVDCEAFANIDTFTTATEKAKTKFDDERSTQRIFYTGGDDGIPYGAYSIIKITAFEGLTGYPAESGATVDLSEIGTDEGEGFLVRIGVDCDDRGHLCARWFWAYEGDALVSSIDWANPVGSTFSGSLTDVLFREATLDENELPVLVLDGCSFTMESFAWDYAVTLASGDGR